MDDFCFERDAEFVGLTLSIVGGDAVAGEEYVALLRIDDDDMARASVMNMREYCGVA